jgi:GH24 family phage-related lysozyme (muramidase)
MIRLTNLLAEALESDSAFVDYIVSVEGTGPGSSPETGHKAYKDSVGVWTIGYGHAATSDPNVKPGLKISDAKAKQFLKNDLAKAEQIVKDYISKNYPSKQLDQIQLKMLTDFTFNGGQKMLSKFPKFITAVINKDWKTASQNYKRYGGGKELTDRNTKFYNTFLKPLLNKKATPPADHGKPIIGKIVYPRNRSSANYANVRTSPEVNTGLIHNFQVKITWPDPVGKIVSNKKDDTGKMWYQVKLMPGIGNGTGYGWVRFDNITPDKNAKYI